MYCVCVCGWEFAYAAPSWEMSGVLVLKRRGRVVDSEVVDEVDMGYRWREHATGRGRVTHCWLRRSWRGGRRRASGTAVLLFGTALLRGTPVTAAPASTVARLGLCAGIGQLTCRLPHDWFCARRRRCNCFKAGN